MRCTSLTRSLLIALITVSSWAATLGPSLANKVAGLPATASAGDVIITFQGNTGLNPSHLAVLSAAGVLRGTTLPHLGMVAIPATAGQVRALAANPAVRSVWANDPVSFLNNETRTLTGVDRARTDPGFMRANGGLPISGKGNFAVLINDSGIDGTHPDLHYPEHVIQNVQAVTDSGTQAGFTPLLVVEGVPDTDTNTGHGTHCAGIVAGTGAASGGLYAGVAPGANLIGFGSGAALFVLNGLGGFEYSIANQARYNIRVISNSWGGQGAFNADDPINVASKMAHDRNIVVAFAAGNSGPGKNTMNPYAKAPWVIGVAAGTKEGGLASFSSRGTPKAERPADSFDAPTITAPGTGREFASDAGKFTSDIVSTRSKTNIFANGLSADAELPVAALPFYTQISGTSMATPFVAGATALLLSVDPTLSPDDVKQIFMQTASQMPGYSEFEIGSGYINVYAALDKVFHRGKNYGSYGGPFDLQHFNAQYSISGPAPQPFHINYSPAALPGPGSANSINFNVQSGMSVLDVIANIDDAAMTGNGNTVGLLLTDPSGVKYGSGIALPILDAPSREVVVKNPAPGPWLLEVRGVRALAALPEVALPTSGAALPGPVDGTITQQQFTLAAIPDIQGDPDQAEIESVLKNRMMDTYVDGNFRPQSLVERADFAQFLVFNTPLRQSLADAPAFSDVSGQAEAIAEAVSASGSTLRDYNFTPAGMLSSSGASFTGGGLITRLDVAVALVRALGLDAAAQAKAGSDVTATSGGQAVLVSDEALIPAGLRGYAQIALDRGILSVSFQGQQAAFHPGDWVTRSSLAYAFDHFRQAFAAGN